MTGILEAMSMEAISAYILVVGLGALFVAVLIWQKKRTGKTICLWLFSGMVGMLLGATIPVAICYLADYKPVKNLEIPAGTGVASGMAPTDVGGMGDMMGAPGGEEPAGEEPGDEPPAPEEPTEE